MISQILAHTPGYVWAILAFLVYRGVAASTDREVAFQSVFVIPLVMLGLSVQGMVSAFGMGGVAAPAWLAGAAVGTLMSWRLIDPAGIVAHRERGTLFLRGGWLPLGLMMAIFCTKYAVAVLLAMQDGLRQHVGFTALVCVSYGLFNGVFLGRLARYVAAYRQPHRAALPA